MLHSITKNTELRKKRKYLREYGKVKSAVAISKGCDKRNIHRKTFRNWQANEASIVDSSLYSRTTTFTWRDSTRYEMGTLLRDEFCDYMMRLASLHINRQLLVSEAAEFQKLLGAPQHTLEINEHILNKARTLSILGRHLEHSKASQKVMNCL